MVIKHSWTHSKAQNPDLGLLLLLGCIVRVLILFLGLLILVLSGSILHGILVFGIFVHVPFQEALQRSQDSLEGGPCDVETGGFAHSINAGFSWLTTEQSNLSKVFTLASDS